MSKVVMSYIDREGNYTVVLSNNLRKEYRDAIRNGAKGIRHMSIEDYYRQYRLASIVKVKE